MTLCDPTRFPVSVASKQPHSTMVTPPCFTVETVDLGLTDSPSLHQITSNINEGNQFQFSLKLDKLQKLIPVFQMVTGEWSGFDALLLDKSHYFVQHPQSPLL